jgi:hypothetical protein
VPRFNVSCIHHAIINCCGCGRPSLTWGACLRGHRRCRAIYNNTLPGTLPASWSALTGLSEL